jgi:glycosyltransferase involved in cell wall biosynthesis
MIERPTRSTSRLVLMPSYNTGHLLLNTVSSTLKAWQPLWIILDGCTDESRDRLSALQAEHPCLRVIELSPNRGKGGAVLEGMRLAHDAGFTHALVMDADGQHPATRIREFMELSEQYPAAMILGEPQFAEDAPFAREYGRRVGNWWANLETWWGGIHDSLFGFRVYPIEPSLGILGSIRDGRRYDFDTILAVRLYWQGVQPVNVKVAVRYFSKAEGGISHFRYWRDNLLLVRAHCVLVMGMLIQLPRLMRKRKQA